MTARWIICEKSGMWATALRWAAGERAPRLWETRSLIECRQEARSFPASLLMLEATLANMEGVIRLIDEVHQTLVRCRCVVLATPAVLRWTDLFLEAGALYVARSPRRLDALVNLAQRHLAAADQGQQDSEDEFWADLPWEQA